MSRTPSVAGGLGVVTAVLALGWAWLPDRAAPRASLPIDSVIFEVHEGTKLAFDLSSDGQSIVFDLLGQLWTLPADGGVATPITDAVRDTSEDRDPVFSPDGQRVAFRADRPGGRGLFLVSSSGGEVRRLTSDPVFGALGSAAWEPNGTRLAYGTRIGPSVRVTILDVAADSVRLLQVDSLPPRPPWITDLTWSPDGSQLLFVKGAGRGGGRLWVVPAQGGVARPFGGEDVAGRGPAYSPDGRRLAFFSADSSGGLQLRVLDPSGAVRTLTSQEDVTPFRVKWTRGGDTLLYHADGRLWRIASSGGQPKEIPFTARVALERQAPQPFTLRLPEAGAVQQAKGFGGLALSPSGKRIAMMALDSLWVFPVGQEPQAVRPLPMTASGVAWAPDEREVVWSAGPGGAEDLYATDVISGATRRVTRLPGSEVRPSWSPDGEHIAFMHWDPGSRGLAASARVASADGVAVDVDATKVLAQTMPPWGFFAPSQESPLWSPDSRAVLVDSVLRFLNGDSLRFTGLPSPPGRPAFLHWGRDSTVYYVRDELLWRAEFDESPLGTRPTRVSDDAALYSTFANDGSVLYVSSDGLRLRQPDGQLERLGWPLSYQTTGPQSVMLANVRVLGSEVAARDILIVGGRIERIAAVGAIQAPAEAQVIDGGERWVMPGLIDLHAHLWDDAVLPAALYYGVTTVRDMGSTGIARLAGHRDAIRAGVRPGPRIVFGAIQFAGARGGLSAPGIHMPSDNAARDRSMAMLEAFGASYVKMRWFQDWAGAARLIAAANERGWSVGGHEAVQLPLVAAGIDGLEHLGPSGERTNEVIYDDIIDLIRTAGLYVVPTVVGYSSVPRVIGDSSVLDRLDTEPLITPFLRWWQLRLGPNAAAEYDRFAEFTRISAGRAHQGGVTVAAGTDAAPLPWALHWELEELVAAGLSPRDAITAATENAARILGAGGKIGVIAEGAWADLILLNANPLDDIRNTQDIWMVIKGGETVDRELLLEQVGRVP